MTEQEIIKFDKFREYYKNNPFKFAEDFLGIQLNPWQKILISILNKGKECKEIVFDSPERRFKRLLAKAQIEYMKNEEMDFWIIKPDCYEKYEKGKLVKTIKRENLNKDVFERG